MEINSIGNINFEAKFKNTKLFNQVVSHARRVENEGGLPFDCFALALDRISRAGEGTIILKNKYSSKYHIYCPSFILGNREIAVNSRNYPNRINALYTDILQMGILGKNLAELFGKKPEELNLQPKFSIKEITKKYT